MRVRAVLGCALDLPLCFRQGSGKLVDLLAGFHCHFSAEIVREPDLLRLMRTPCPYARPTSGSTSALSAFPDFSKVFAASRFASQSRALLAHSFEPLKSTSRRTSNATGGAGGSQPSGTVSVSTQRQKACSA